MSPFGILEKNEFDLGTSIAWITEISKPSSLPLYEAKVLITLQIKGANLHIIKGGFKIPKFA